MKRFFSKATLVLALASVPSLVNAQSPSQAPSVDYGRTTVQLGASFVNALQGMGAVLTDLHNNPIQNNAFSFQAVAGALDLTTSAGEIEHTGGLVVNAGGLVLRIQNLTIDTSNPMAPVVTAEFILNDHFTSRIPLFNIQAPAGTSLPLQLQAGVLQQNGLMLTLAPAAASTLDGLFGGPVVTAGTNIGTANVYVVFSPSN